VGLSLVAGELAMIKKEPRPEPLTVTAQDIAANLHCSEATVYKLFAKGFEGGGLDALKFGKKTLALREQLDHLIDNLPHGIASEIGVTGAKMAAANARRIEAGLPPLRTGRAPKAIAALVD
jgi:DNA-binding MurR/RpiR family transcriptional regulator